MTHANPNPFDYRTEPKHHAGYETRRADQRRHGRAISLPVYPGPDSEALGLEPTNAAWNEGWSVADADILFEAICRRNEAGLSS